MHHFTRGDKTKAVTLFEYIKRAEVIINAPNEFYSWCYIYIILENAELKSLLKQSMTEEDIEKFAWCLGDVYANFGVLGDTVRTPNCTLVYTDGCQDIFLQYLEKNPDQFICFKHLILERKSTRDYLLQHTNNKNILFMLSVVI